MLVQHHIILILLQQQVPHCATFFVRGMRMSVVGVGNDPADATAAVLHLDGTPKIPVVPAKVFREAFQRGRKLFQKADEAFAFQNFLGQIEVALEDRSGGGIGQESDHPIVLGEVTLRVLFNAHVFVGITVTMLPGSILEIVKQGNGSSWMWEVWGE